MSISVQKQEKVPKTPWQYASLMLGPHKWLFFSVVFIVMLAAGLDQATSYLFKLIIDAVESGNTAKVFWFGIAIPVVVFCIQMLFRLSGVLVMSLSTNTRKDGYDYLFSYISNHSHTYYSNRFSGGVHSKIRNVVEGMDSIIPDFIWTYIYSFSALLVTFFFIASVDLVSALIFIFLVITLLIINHKLSPLKQKASKENAEAKTKMNATMLDALSNISTIRQYARTSHEVALVAITTEEMKSKNKATWMMTEYILIINSLVLFIFSGSLFWILATRWQSGEVSTGEFVLVASLITQLSGTLLFIGRAFNSTAQTLGEMKEGLEDLMLPHEIVDTESNSYQLETKGGEIEWINVKFTYDTFNVFENFNLLVPRGQKIGLVGASGAGKSTFASLMLRQHELVEGIIKIDGQDISKVTQDSLRESIAVVPQEPSLFHRSIRDNIAYSRPESTLEEIIEVAKKASAHSFIEKLPKGYDTLVGERGVKLSGGQKQRVAIARAMLKNAPILILDEATSALDSESEKEIQSALHILMRGKTVIAIAHRLSTLREMDRIIVLEDGKIKEDGNHKSLVEKSGLYAKLWQHQAGGFILE